MQNFSKAKWKQPYYTKAKGYIVFLKESKHSVIAVS